MHSADGCGLAHNMLSMMYDPHLGRRRVGRNAERVAWHHQQRQLCRLARRQHRLILLQQLSENTGVVRTATSTPASSVAHHRSPDVLMSHRQACNANENMVHLARLRVQAATAFATAI